MRNLATVNANARVHLSLASVSASVGLALGLTLSLPGMSFAERFSFWLPGAGSRQARLARHRERKSQQLRHG
jgi:hypothetical protein